MLWKLFCPHDKKNMVKDSPSATLEELGWRQCSIVVGSDIPSLKENVRGYQDDDIFIVLPYSCAVVQMNFEKEPNIELFRVRKAEKKDKGIQYGRNPRQLQIEVQSGSGILYADGLIHDRFFIDHSFFVNCSPNSELSLNERECVTVKNWFAKRYIRNALPTEFNKRAKSALKNLLKTLKSRSELDEILGVYLTLDPRDQELSNIDDPYDITVDFLVTESGMRNSELIKIRNQFEEDLKKCSGILLSQIELKSDTEVLLSEYRNLIRLDDYDFISHRDEHEDPMVS